MAMQGVDQSKFTGYQQGTRSTQITFKPPKGTNAPMNGLLETIDSSSSGQVKISVRSIKSAVVPFCRIK